MWKLGTKNKNSSSTIYGGTRFAVLYRTFCAFLSYFYIKGWSTQNWQKWKTHKLYLVETTCFQNLSFFYRISSLRVIHSRCFSQKNKNNELYISL
jgi:hypothetical protein